jgi:Putative beta-barrel porin 2
VCPSRAGRPETMGMQPSTVKAAGRIIDGALSAALSAVLLFGCATAAFTQEAPPLDAPIASPLVPGDAMRAGEWLLYPTLRGYAGYSDNLLQSPVNPVSTGFFGLDPGMIAEWGNGIHSTTVYGNADLRDYPSANELNAFDDKVGVVQRYSPLPDWVFKIQGDYTHSTWATGLINAIPGVFASPGTSTLANGNIILPNGTIVSPTGQTVGQLPPGLNVANPTTVVNPNDTLTGTAAIEKILNNGFIGLTGGIARTEYQNVTLDPDYTVGTFNGTVSYGLGPLFYIYSNGSLAVYSTQFTTGTIGQSAYRAVGGIGTRQIGSFAGSAYFGQQGSDVQNSGTAGGSVYGGRLLYYATPDLTFTLGFDETINNSSQTGTTNLALTLPTQSVLVIPISASTQISDYTLRASYTISPQWSVFGNFGYLHTEFLGSSQFEDAWLADAVLRYSMTRELTLAWEYQFSSIVSNIPVTSSKRNAAVMSATYKF